MDIEVSVYCATYNQMKYIRKAIESFLMQETTFPYEIIIHDDASTDGTAEIVKEYADRYPDKIIPILQTENQYSKGVNFFRQFVLPIVRGRYIANCEGDDFWTDKHKLQLQYDALEAHPECSRAVHLVIGISEDEKKQLRIFPRNELNISEGIVKASEIIHMMLADNEWVFQTSSVFSRKRIINELISENHLYYLKGGPGDYVSMLGFALKGDIYYIEKSMSCYRINAVGSVTDAAHQDEKNKKMLEKRIYSLEKFDEKSDYLYHQDVQMAIKRFQFFVLKIDKQFKEMLHSKWKDNYRELPMHVKMDVCISAYLPWFNKMYLWLRKRVKGY